MILTPVPLQTQTTALPRATTAATVQASGMECIYSVPLAMFLGKSRKAKVRADRVLTYSSQPRKFLQ